MQLIKRKINGTEFYIVVQKKFKFTGSLQLIKLIKNL